MDVFCQDRQSNRLGRSSAWFASGGSCLPKDTRARPLARTSNVKLPLSEQTLARTRVKSTALTN